MLSYRQATIAIGENNSLNKGKLKTDYIQKTDQVFLTLLIMPVASLKQKSMDHEVDIIDFQSTSNQNKD